MAEPDTALVRTLAAATVLLAVSVSVVMAWATARLPADTLPDAVTVTVVTSADDTKFPPDTLPVADRVCVVTALLLTMLLPVMLPCAVRLLRTTVLPVVAAMVTAVAAKNKLPVTVPASENIFAEVLSV